MNDWLFSDLNKNDPDAELNQINLDKAMKEIEDTSYIPNYTNCPPAKNNKSDDWEYTYDVKQTYVKTSNALKGFMASHRNGETLLKAGIL